LVISIKGMMSSVPWLEPKIGPSVAVHPPPSNKPLPFQGNLIFRQESIKSLLRTLTARDPYTGCHSVRVTNIALTFGRFLSLSTQELGALSNAGYLHDIGKIGISDSILLKPGPLTPPEMAVIQTHPLIGAKIVEPLGFTSQEKNLILLHHERWDGQGYPQGLQGSSIPFLCRLLALADVFDALTSNRPYRQAFTTSEALAEIEAQAGHQFDPDLSRQFIHLAGSLDPQKLFYLPPPPWLADEW
jgi:HD-GYP domain-containing protein (c-di-GMP phosphodiesterase class II)